MSHVMRLYHFLFRSGLFILCFYLTTPPLSARQQPAKEILLTFTVKDSSIKYVFKIIEKQSQHSFFFPSELIDRSKKVSLSFTNAPLSKVLYELFHGSSITWEITSNTIILRKAIPIPASLDSLITVTGIVKNHHGELLPGASVAVLNKGYGIATSTDGKFTLLQVNKTDKLLISYIGYKDSVISINGNRILNIIMEDKKKDLGEVIIIAYGTTNKRTYTGNVASVKAVDIEKQPVSNPLMTLQGRTTGVQVLQNSGIPGGNYNIQVRGQNSLRNNAAQTGNNPLYIVDGVPFISGSIDFLDKSPFAIDLNSPFNGISALNSLNKEDIQSIDVLKDADATAIYGSRAANAVVLITTKKGKEGPLTLHAKVSAGIGRTGRKMELLNTQQYLEMRHEALRNENAKEPTANEYDINGKWDTTRYTDWQKELIGGTAWIKNAQADISGGTKTIQYFVSGGYYHETTVFPGDYSSQRLSTHANINTVSRNNRLKSATSVNYADGKTILLAQDITKYALMLAPNAPSLYTKDGKLNWQNQTFISNPMANAHRPYENRVNNLIANGQLSYRLVDSLILRASGGWVSNKIDANRKRFKTSFLPDPDNNVTIPLLTNFATGKIQSWIIEPQATYKRVSGKLECNMLIGATFQDEVTTVITTEAEGFQNESLMEDIRSATRVDSISRYSEYKYGSMFGRIGFNWDAKYILNFSARRDGSSRFGLGNQFANFWAIGAAWVFSEEKFIKEQLPFLSLAKLRGSYGITGSDQIPNYEYMGGYTTVNGGQFHGIQGYLPTRLENPSYQWEENRKAEVALELGFDHDRISFSAAYFRNRSSNQLLGLDLPPTAGVPSVQYNNKGAIVQNTGLEIEVADKNVIPGDVAWYTSFNLTIPRNKLIAFPGLENSEYADKLLINQPLSIARLYYSSGVDPQTGLYQIDGSNSQYFKNTGQKLYGGWQNTLTWKSLEVDALFYFVIQDGYNYLYVTKLPGLFNQNQPVEVLDRWRQRGDVKPVQRFSNLLTGTAGTANGLHSNSNDLITDASYLRLRSLSITCQLPLAWRKKLRLQAARIFLEGQNLITITKYKGLDPENQYRGLPPLKQLFFGFKITI